MYYSYDHQEDRDIPDAKHSTSRIDNNICKIALASIKTNLFRGKIKLSNPKLFLVTENKIFEKWLNNTWNDPQ